VTTLGSVRIRGVVRKGGAPVEGAYLTLNTGKDGTEFIAERRTGPDGVYEFHTSPGDWTVICRAAGSDATPLSVSSGGGEISLDFDL
jgi:uncharacterized protein DUF1416